MKKEEPDTVEPKQEKMEVDEKKPEIKAEAKEEEDSGANTTSATSQNRKKSKDIGPICIKSVEIVANLIDDLFLDHFTIIIFCTVFKPEELRQALMPTLEALYRQDPESLPFRQPVDPMLLGIPVSINIKLSIVLSKPKLTECFAKYTYSRFRMRQEEFEQNR